MRATLAETSAGVFAENNHSLVLGIGAFFALTSNPLLEAFANNVTDEAHPTQATIDTGTQVFVFNPPRTYGLRMRVSF